MKRVSMNSFYSLEEKADMDKFKSLMMRRKKQVMEECIHYGSIYNKIQTLAKMKLHRYIYTKLQGIIITKFKAVVTSRKGTQRTSKELIFYSFGE